MRALERRDRLDRPLEQGRELPSGPLDRLGGFIRRSAAGRLFTPSVRAGSRSLFRGLVLASAGPCLRRLLFGARRLFSLLGRLLARPGLRLGRFLFGRRLVSVAGGLGLALIAGGECSRCRSGCANRRACRRHLGSVLDRLERLFPALGRAVAWLILCRGGLAPPAFPRLRAFALRFCRLGHLRLLLLFESCEQLVLDGLVLLSRDRSELELPLGLGEPSPQRPFVPELALGLRGQLLGYPHCSPHRSERQGQQPSEEAHQRAPAVRPTKLCGASGPRYLKCIRSACCCASSFIASSNAATRSRSTRNDAPRTWCSIGSWSTC